MATQTPLRIVEQSGVLYADPTSLSSVSGYGTCLGYVKDLEFRFGRRVQPITAEEWGGAPVDGIDMGEWCVVAGVLRGLDPDALNKVFVNTAAGTSSGERIVKGAVNGTVRAGYSLFGKAFKLLFAPDDTARGTFIIVYQAIPMVDEAAAMQMRLGAEKGVAVAFWGVPETAVGTTKAVYQVGVKQDISITAP